MSLDYENRKLHIFVSVYTIIKACSVTQVLARSYVLVLNEVTFPLTRMLIHLAI